MRGCGGISEDYLVAKDRAHLLTQSECCSAPEWVTSQISSEGQGCMRRKTQVAMHQVEIVE